MIVGNRKVLLSHGTRRAREIALDILETALQDIDASSYIRDLVTINQNILRVGELEWDLSAIDHIYVLGAGKGILQMAEALEEILGDRVSEGVVVEKQLNGMARGLERISHLRKIQVIQGGHPIPDEAAVEGAQLILDIARRADSKDLVFCCVQGGCTSLSTLPVEGIHLKDIQIMTDLLLRSGYEIQTVNSLRSAVTALSDGRLAASVYPAEIINLVVTDSVWSYPYGWENVSFTRGWGPCVPAADYKIGKLADDLAQFKNSELWKNLPLAIRDYLAQLQIAECFYTEKQFRQHGIRVHTFVLANTEHGAEAAVNAARNMGLNTIVVTTAMEGEARDAGIFWASMAKEVIKNHRPVPPSCALIFAGEMTVTLDRTSCGTGGRNQEAVLSAASNLDGAERVAVLSVGTDGTDGPNPVPVAGGIVDGHTVKRASAKDIQLSMELSRHNSYYVLDRLCDAVFFDEPGNNVCDLTLVVVI